MFLTAGETEVRAWTIPMNSTAVKAAGAIHSDFEKKFIRAEVVNWKTLVDHDGYPGVREKGLLRLEGKEYIVKDGDVLVIRHSVRTQVTRLRSQRAEQRRTIAVARVEGQVVPIIESRCARRALRDTAAVRARTRPRGIDGGGDAVVGGAQNPAAILGGAHAHDLQVLLARGALAELAVVRNLNSTSAPPPANLPHEVREHRFVADERADAGASPTGETTTRVAGGEIAGLGGDLVGDSRRATARIRRRAPGSPCRSG